MWYFAWLLGLPLAAAFAVLNAMWFELVDDAKRRPLSPAPLEDGEPQRLRA
jgi:cyd operon protein YbgT